MDNIDIVIIIAGLVFSAALYIIAGIAAKLMSSKWKICYCVPAVVCMFLTAVSGFEISMLGAYIGALLPAAGFFREKLNFRRVMCALSAACIIISLPVCLLNAGYRSPDYLRDFEKGFADMKKRYILSDHKGINWDELYEKYQPRFKAANSAHDAEANFLAWACFCAEFHDGHVMFVPEDTSLSEKLNRELSGNDYGLSFISLPDGRAAAVNVDENSIPFSAGIRNGTIITKWDGLDPYDAAARSKVNEVTSYPDKDNEDFYRLVPAAGTGGESVEIVFLDENGSERTVTAPKTGDYYDRYKMTMDTIDQGIAAANLSWTELDEKTAALRIKLMEFDGRAARSDDYSLMKIEIRKKVNEYKEAGYDKMIIDLRSNGGGSGMMVKAIAEIFAPEGEHYYCTDGLWDDLSNSYMKDETGKYIAGKDNYYTGENVWEGRPVVMLVNAHSVSAADHLTMVMHDLPNVTVMGFTEPNGSAQGIAAASELESGSLVFSNSLLLNRDGSIFIDSGTDRESGDDVEIKIPFDEAAVRSLFDDKEDYLLKKALEFLYSESSVE